MTKFIVYLTFIPWFLYFSLLCKDALHNLQNKKISWKWIKKNIFSIFHFPNIILFAIFTYFSLKYSGANQIWITNVLLFSAIYLYLFINHYYDKYKSRKNVDSMNMSTILIILIITLIPIIYYISSNNYIATYYILFGYSFFNYIIVYIAKIINDLLLKKLFKNDKE